MSRAEPSAPNYDVAEASFEVVVTAAATFSRDLVHLCPPSRLNPPPVKPLALLLSCAIALSSGCLVDDEAQFVGGDVAVTVTDQRGQPVPGARVYTEPASRIEDLADEFGTVSIRRVTAGTYDVFAEFEGARARTVLFVGPGQLASARLQLPLALPGGGNPDGSPRFFITSPEQARTYAAGEAIEFSATASDDATPGTGITIRWVSNLDGVLGEGRGDLNGRYVFSRVLSGGFHQLTATATDGDGDATELRWSVNVAGVAPLRLDAPDPVDDGVRLTWRPHASRDFRSYTLQRAGGDCAAPGFDAWRAVATFDRRSDTTYLDASPPPIGEAVCYRLVLATAGDARAAVSEVVTYAPGAEGRVAFVPSALAAHPTQADIVYLVDAVGERVVRYDIGRGEITAEAALSGALGQPTVGAAGQGTEVFVPSDNGNVFVLDAATLARRSVISTVDPVGSVAAFSDGFIVVGGVSAVPREGQLRSYSRSAGTLLGESTTVLGPGRIARVPLARAIVAQSSEAGQASLTYVTLAADGAFVSEATRVAESGGADVLAVDPRARYLVAGARANSYDVGPGLGYRGRLDFGTADVWDVAFSADGDVAYGAIAPGDDGSDRPRGLLVASLPTRLREGLLVTRGYVRAVARLADGRLATVQVSDDGRAALLAVLP